jgi:N-acyl-D-amino-acid deacylase
VPSCCHEQPEDTNHGQPEDRESLPVLPTCGATTRTTNPICADRIDRRAKAAGVSVEEFAYDLLLANDGKAIFYQPGANYRDGNLNAVREMLGHPRNRSWGWPTAAPTTA